MQSSDVIFQYTTFYPGFDSHSGIPSNAALNAQQAPKWAEKETIAKREPVAPHATRIAQLSAEPANIQLF